MDMDVSFSLSFSLSLSLSLSLSVPLFLMDMPNFLVMVSHVPLSGGQSIEDYEVCTSMSSKSHHISRLEVLPKCTSLGISLILKQEDRIILLKITSNLSVKESLGSLKSLIPTSIS